jgi:hypothetical protein
LRFLVRRSLPLVALLVALTSHADTPLFGPRPEVLPSGQCDAELQLGRREVDLGWSVRKGGSTTASVECGVAPGHQLGLVAQRSRFDGDKHQELGLQGKWALHQAPTWSLAFDYRVLGRDRVNGREGWRVGASGIGFSAGVRLGESQGLRGSVMRELPRGGSGETTVRLAYDYAISPSLNLVAQSDWNQGRRPQLGLGLEWAPAAGWRLGASLARDRAVEKRSDTAYQLQVGLRRQF